MKKPGLQATWSTEPLCACVRACVCVCVRDVKAIKAPNQIQCDFCVFLHLASSVSPELVIGTLRA